MAAQPAAGSQPAVPYEEHQQVLADHAAAIDAQVTARVDAETKTADAVAAQSTAEETVAGLHAELQDSHARERALADQVAKLKARVDELQKSGVGPGSGFYAGRNMTIVGADGATPQDVVEGDPIPHVAFWPHLKLWIESGHILVRDRAAPGEKRSHADPHMAPAPGILRSPVSGQAADPAVTDQPAADAPKPKKARASKKAAKPADPAVTDQPATGSQTTSEGPSEPASSVPTAADQTPAEASADQATAPTPSNPTPTETTDPAATSES